MPDATGPDDSVAEAILALRSRERSALALFDDLRAVIGWEPQEEDIRQPRLRFLLSWWWRACVASGTVPPVTPQIDPMELRPALGFIAVLEVVDEGADFRFRLYGSAIAERVGFDMTGKTVSALPSPGNIAGFLLATYRAALCARAPLYTEHAPPPLVSTTRWHRLILPLAAPSGAIRRLVVGMEPSAAAIEA